MKRAAAQTDEGAANTVAQLAAKAQEGWRCPNAGYPEPSIEDPPLDPARRQALRNVKHVTGACGFRTCPIWYTQHEWIAEAIAAWRAEGKGQMRERVGWPSLALYQAVEAIDASFLARKAHELKKLAKKPEDDDE